MFAKLFSQPIFLSLAACIFGALFFLLPPAAHANVWAYVWSAESTAQPGYHHNYTSCAQLYPSTELTLFRINPAVIYLWGTPPYTRHQQRIDYRIGTSGYLCYNHYSTFLSNDATSSGQTGPAPSPTPCPLPPPNDPSPCGPNPTGVPELPPEIVDVANNAACDQAAAGIGYLCLKATGGKPVIAVPVCGVVSFFASYACGKLLENSPATMAIALNGDLRSTFVQYGIPFVVSNAGDGDWLALYYNGVMFWKQPLANFAVDTAYFVPAPNAFLSENSSDDENLIVRLHSTGAANAVVGIPLIVRDADEDGVSNDVDNCSGIADPSQCDSDGDGYGNRCDGDMNNNNSTNAQDTTLYRQQLGQPSVAPTFNAADLNCNGAVNAQDTTLFRQLLGTAPGPSGLVP